MPSRLAVLIALFVISPAQGPTQQTQAERRYSSTRADNEGPNEVRGRGKGAPLPPPEENSQPEQATRGDTQPVASGNNGDDKRSYATGPWIVLLTAGLVLVGALQILLLRRQTKIIDGSLRVAHQSLILTQRPRLVVRSLSLDEPSYANRFTAPKVDEPIFEPGKRISGRFVVVNSGGSKAVVRGSFCSVFHSGEFEQLPMKLPRQAKMGQILLAPDSVLQPGESAEVTFVGDGPSPEQVERAKSLKLSALGHYVLGWIEYSDDIGVGRKTAFCRRYQAGSGELIPERFVPLQDPDHEYAD